MSLTLLLVTLCLLICVTHGLSPHRAMILLSKYGYLTLPASNSLNNPLFERSLIMDGSYKKAILKFQDTFKLPKTGILSPKVRRMLLAKRCGNPDFGNDPLNIRMNIRLPQTRHDLLRRVKRYFIDNPHMKWLKNDLTWKIKSDAFPSKNLNKPQVRAILTNAFNVWGKHVNLNFAEQVNPQENADIIIEFGSREHGDSIPFDGPNYVLAHAFYPIGSNSPAYSRAGDAHFDDDEDWVDGNENGKNLLAVAVHELGHSMGLGHSASEKAIMYPFYVAPSGKGLELDKDDIEGMQSIYGRADPNKHLPVAPETPKDIPNIPDRRPTTRAPDVIKKINFCDTNIDAIIIIREVELYVFSGKLQWRIDFSKTVTSWISYELRDGPEELSYYWPILPNYINGIDGGIERNDQKIYIFKDTKFWVLEDNVNLTDKVPKDGLPLTVLGLPPHLQKIDTIFRWGYNKEIYIMAGYQYWKINEKSGNFGYIYPRYPRDINAVWKNIPLPIDVAYTGLHGKTFFIKGKYYYEFNNLEMKIDEDGPRPLTPAWIGCKISR